MSGAINNGGTTSAATTPLQQLAGAQLAAGIPIGTGWLQPGQNGSMTFGVNQSSPQGLPPGYTAGQVNSILASNFPKSFTPGLPTGAPASGAGGSGIPWWQAGAGARPGVAPSPTGMDNYGNLPNVPFPQFPTPAMNLARFGQAANSGLFPPAAPPASMGAPAPQQAPVSLAPAPQQAPGSNAPAQSIFQQIAAKAPLDVYGNTTQSSVPTAAPQAPTMSSIAGIPLPASTPSSGGSSTSNFPGFLGGWNAWQNALLATGNYTLSPNAQWNNGPVTPAPAPAPAPTATGTDTWPPTNPTPVAQSGGGGG